MPLRAGVRRFVSWTAQTFGDARDFSQKPLLLEGQIAIKDQTLHVVRDGEAKRTNLVQNEFKAVNGVEEASPRPASKGTCLVDVTGFSDDRDARVQDGGVVCKRN